MPNTSIHYAPGFSSLAKITDTLYTQCFVGQGIHPSYASALQQQVALICQWSGLPALHSQVTVNQYAFTIVDLRYTAYRDAVLVQFGFVAVPAASASPAKSRSIGAAPAGVLPALEGAGTPADAVAAS